MARAVVYANGELKVVTRAVPEPADPKQVVVRLLLRPLHRSYELNEAARVSSRIQEPAVPGYEGVGVVHSVRTKMHLTPYTLRMLYWETNVHRDWMGIWNLATVT